jgi:hypothetical protein
MSITLTEAVTDYLVLPFSKSIEFDYFTLLSFCRDISDLEYLNFKSWKDVSFRKFRFPEEDALLYFETCTIFYYNESLANITDILKIEIPKVVFVLFLYVQLYNISEQFKEECQLRTKNHAQEFPERAIVSRKSMVNYFKYTSMDWLRAISTSLTWKNKNNESIESKINFFDLKYLEQFFKCKIPKGKLNQQRLVSDFNTKSRKKDHEDLYDISLVEMLQLVTKQNNNESKLTLEILDQFINYFIIDHPLDYSLLIGRNGGNAIGEINISILRQNTVLLIANITDQTVSFNLMEETGHSLILNRLINCEVYIFGCVKNILITSCLDTKIFCSLVGGTVKLLDCKNIHYSGICCLFVYEAGTDSSENTASINTPLRPRIYQIDDSNTNCLRLSPCNQWSDGLNYILKRIRWLTTNLWNQPIIVTKAPIVEDITEIIPPFNFYFEEIPFRFSTLDEPLSILPEPYDSWVSSMKKIKYITRIILEKANKTDSALEKHLVREFKAYLNSSNYLYSLASFNRMSIENQSK